MLLPTKAARRCYDRSSGLLTYHARLPGRRTDRCSTQNDADGTRRCGTTCRSCCNLHTLTKLKHDFLCAGDGTPRTWC